MSGRHSDPKRRDPSRNDARRHATRAARSAAAELKRNRKLLALVIAIVAIVLITVIVLNFVRPQWFEPLYRMLGIHRDSGSGGTGNSDNPDNIGSTNPGPENPDNGGSTNPAPDNPDNSGSTTITGDMLEMTVLDIGQGDCIYIQLPDGQNMLVDIGSEFGTQSPWTAFEKLMQDKQVTRLDHVMFTHTDYDHTREGKKLIDRFEIRNFYVPLADDQTTATWNKVITAARAETYTDEGGQVQTATVHESVGAFTIAGDGWQMACYSYERQDYPNVSKDSSALDKNSVSPICVLTYAGRTIVLTGDANEKNEPYILSRGYLDDVDADVLKVAHHGSKTSTMQSFLDTIDAEYAIISCGADNDYGHPTQQLLDRLAQYRDVTPDGDYDGFDCVYRTDTDGDVIVQIGKDGTMNVLSEKVEANNRTLRATSVRAVVWIAAQEYGVCVVCRRESVYA